jgi:hypothetical protein
MACPKTVQMLLLAVLMVVFITRVDCKKLCGWTVRDLGKGEVTCSFDTSLLLKDPNAKRKFELKKYGKCFGRMVKVILNALVCLHVQVK